MHPLQPRRLQERRELREGTSALLAQHMIAGHVVLPLCRIGRTTFQQEQIGRLEPLDSPASARLWREGLLVDLVLALADDRERDQVVEEDVSLHLRVDHLALLLVRQLEQIDDDETVLVELESHALRARGDHQPIAGDGHLLVHKLLDGLLHASRLVHAIDEDDERAHLVRLHKHSALGTLKVPLDVPQQPRARLEQVGDDRGLLPLLTHQAHDALHVHDQWHEPHPPVLTRLRLVLAEDLAPALVAVGRAQPLRELVSCLLDHPRLARTRAGTHKGGLSEVDAASAFVRGREEQVDELVHVLHRVPCRVRMLDRLAQILRRDANHLVFDAQLVASDRILNLVLGRDDARAVHAARLVIRGFRVEALL